MTLCRISSHWNNFLSFIPRNNVNYGFLADFAFGFNRQYIAADPLLDDMAVGKRLCQSLNRKRLLTDQQIAMAYDSISNDKVRQLLLANNDDLKSQLTSADNVLAERKMSADASSTYSIIDIDPKMSAEQI